LRRISAKIRKVERRSKRQLDYAETKYLRRQPKYEKSSAEASASLIMPRRSIYDEVKDTNKREQCQIYLNIAEREYLRRQPKIRLSRMQCKFICFLPRRSIYDEVKDTIKSSAMQIYLLFAEAKYPPGVSQRYEPAAASPAARFQKERNEGFFMVRS